MIAEGAVMIDVGGQSTRPGFIEISAEDEIARIQPVVEKLTADSTALVSIDTYKPAVARAALAAGAQVLNDINGLQASSEMADLAAEFGCAVIAMHREPAFRESTADVLDLLRQYFERTFDVARRAGIALERLILDPGIGFHKTQQQNLELMARLGEMRAWGFPILLGASRKSTIGQALDLPVEQRLEGTLATTAAAAWQGVDFVRVHDVRPNLLVAKMIHAIRSSSRS
jgi:dihydropteroate synthase